MSMEAHSIRKLSHVISTEINGSWVIIPSISLGLVWRTSHWFASQFRFFSFPLSTSQICLSADWRSCLTLFHGRHAFMKLTFYCKILRQSSLYLYSCGKNCSSTRHTNPHERLVTWLTLRHVKTFVAHSCLLRTKWALLSSMDLTPIEMGIGLQASLFSSNTGMGEVWLSGCW